MTVRLKMQLIGATHLAEATAQATVVQNVARIAGPSNLPIGRVYGVKI
jgi:hypothetical protein